MTREQEKYIELVLEPKVKNEKGQLAYGIATSWAYIAAYKEKRTEDGHTDASFKEKGDEIQKDYKNLDSWIAERVCENRNEIEKIEKLKKEFAVAKGRWDTQKHRTGFADFEACQKCVEQADEVEYEKGKYGFETFKSFYE